MRNPGPADLVYLSGGENRDFEVADFPRLGKRMVRTGKQLDVYDHRRRSRPLRIAVRHPRRSAFFAFHAASTAASFSGAMPALSLARSSSGRVRCQASVSSTVFLSGVIFEPLGARGLVAGAGERRFVALGRQPDRHLAPRLHFLLLEELRR